MRRETFDEVDRRIIAHLQQDGRRPYTTIARDIGISEAGVRQRVARLVRRKVIQIVAASDPIGLGLLSAEVLLRVAGDRVQAIAEELARYPQVDYVGLAAGQWDLIIGIVCRDRAELHEMIVNRIRPLPGVQQLDFQLVLKVLKDTYQWSPAPLAGGD
jgi:Lrp/AsnC family transcriptional regulator for asnA, asnC and gidA